MVYRGLGQLDKAAPHLRQWRNTTSSLPDPLQQELDLLLESGLSYELRGVRALDARDFNDAAAFFRKGVELTPGITPLRRSLQHKLGTALFMTGQLDAAAEQFEAVVREAPAEAIDESAAKAYYSLGVLEASKGRWATAGERFAAAVHYQPNYVEARLALADAQRRSGQAPASLREYRGSHSHQSSSRPGAAGLCDEPRRPSALRQGARLARRVGQASARRTVAVARARATARHRA